MALLAPGDADMVACYGSVGAAAPGRNAPTDDAELQVAVTEAVGSLYEHWPYQ